MYARTEFVYTVLLVASFFEGSQATLQVRATIGTTLASPSVSPTAMLSFHPLPQPTSCASTTFSWSYSGPDDPLLLQVTNVGVSQDAPPSTASSSTTSSSTTSSIATIRNLPRLGPTIPLSPLDLTVTLVTNYEPSALSYDWDTVNVSQGWYMLLANISTNPVSQTPSPPFFIRTGTNMSCLGVTGISTNTLTPTITPSTSSSPPVTSIPASDLSSTSSSKVPTIVGVSVGMAVLLIGSLIVWFILTRKGKSRTSDGNNKNSFHRWKGIGDSRGGFDANVPNNRYRSSRSHLTSQPASIASTLGPEFEDSMLGAEKLPDEHGVALSTLPVLQHQSSRTRPVHTYSPSSSSSNLNDSSKSSVRYSTQHSVDSSAVYPPFSFSSRESGQHMGAHDVLRSHSLSTTGTQYSLSNSNDSSPITPISPSFPPPPSITSRESKQMHRQSIGKKRKPAPVYDPSGDEPISSTSAIFAIPPLPFSTNSESTFPELSHKSSFGPGGIEGKPLHYLIPDMPLSHTS